MNRLKIKLILFALLFLDTGLYLTAQSFTWPDGKKAAIVLTYDDGLDSHLNYAIPQLDAAGFKGTFFLYGYLSENRFSDWKAVSDRGHELGNHSLFHPCKGNGTTTKSPRFYSEDYDVPSILREIGIMSKLIFAISEKKPVSYAYPCGETLVGGIDYSDSLRHSGLVKYARNGRNTDGIVDFHNIDFFKIPAFAPPVNADAECLSDYVRKVKSRGALGILLFHGVGGDYLSVGAKEHQKLVDFLVAYKDEIWICTFSDAMEYIQNKCKSIKTK